LALYVTLGIAGCSKPEPDNLHTVRGTILLDGKPLPRGSVSLRAMDQSSWEQPTGVVDENGQFTMFTQGQEGVAPGQYKVIVFATEAAFDEAGKPHPGLPRSLIPVCYNDPEKTPLRLEVAGTSPPPQYDLELSSHAK
jgi:hypothetical protein